MKLKTPELAYFHVGRTTFVEKDISFFQQEYNVRQHHFQPAPKWLMPLELLKQLFWLLSYGWSARIYIVQFAGYHTLLPSLMAKLRRIPVLVIASGTESVRYPSISYGNFAKPLYRFFTAATFRLGSHVAAVHRTLISSENTYYITAEKKQGFREHLPNLNVPSSEIPYGFDSAKWKMSETAPINTFITVAHIWNKMRYVLKGIDLIVDAATDLPDCHFTVVGMTYEPDVPIPPNVKIIESAPNTELPELYQQHEFYVQMSISEGHPNAICEAMLCGCIPIGSDVAAIPDIIGDTGFLVPKRSKQDFVAAIVKAQDARSETQRNSARERIVRNYPIERRRASLLNLVQYLTA